MGNSSRGGTYGGQWYSCLLQLTLIVTVPRELSTGPATMTTVNSRRGMPYVRPSLGLVIDTTKIVMDTILFTRDTIPHVPV
jgi:hypothetical protein